MPVRIVSSPFHRSRCVSCGGRVADVKGPFVDFGVFDDAPVELLEGTATGKTQHHEQFLVCAGCMLKAVKVFPGLSDRESKFRSQVQKALAERDRALQLVSALSKEVHGKIDDALASGPGDPAGQSNMTLPSPETQAPPQLASTNEEVPADTPPDSELDLDDLDGKTVRQLRGLARERGIEVPSSVQSKPALVEHLANALTDPQEGE